MQDSDAYAKNFQQKAESPNHKYNRVVTVFLLPMTDDRKIGMRISENEYLDLFVTSPGSVTALTRLDKGDYWVLCRETFLGKSIPNFNINEYKPYLSHEENRLLWSFYNSEIDSTRFLIASQF
jgi:hypothetical protein